VKVKKPRGNLFVVSAPSGAGKTTLCRRLLSMVEGITFSVSYTTRAPRPDEVEGSDYFFVSEDEFRKMVEAGEFAEWAEVHGNLYGTSKKRLDEALDGGMDILLDIDVQGARQLRDSYPDGVFIFVLPPAMATLSERLRGRMSDTPEVIAGRLRKAVDEIRDYANYNYVIVNNIFEQALRELEAVVVSRRLSSARVDSEWVEKNFLKQEED
jgi:guanylate kinase